MRCTFGGNDLAGSFISESASFSPKFIAFLKRLNSGKKVTDFTWLAMEEYAGEHMPPLDTQALSCSHPRVNGQGYTAIRITILKRIAKSDHLSAAFAKAELLRRGHLEIPIEVSIHAIDKASSRYWKVWLQKRRAQQGLASWLKEQAMKAYQESVAIDDNIFVREYMGMTFCFQAKKKTLKLVSVN